MCKSQIDKAQREQVMNSGAKHIAPTCQPANANIFVEPNRQAGNFRNLLTVSRNSLKGTLLDFRKL